MQRFRMLLLLLCVSYGLPLGAQPSTDDNAILAYAAPYRMEWRQGRGVFVRKALGNEKEIRQPLTFLHTDTGPKGSSKYLAWFLARDRTDFAILWCYLDDAGRDFWCWLYRFPSNQLTTVHFLGGYRFTPPKEPTQPTIVTDFQLRLAPLYEGQNFLYKDWSRRSGSLANLSVSPTTSQNVAAPNPTTKEIKDLNVIPLHDITVPGKNGWREGGWKELHTLAYDNERDPYYLILYSNSTKGFAIDLKRGLTFTAQYGEKVVFGNTEKTDPKTPEEPPKPEPPNEKPVVNGVKPNELYEIVLHSKTPHENPYQEVLLEADIKTPEGKIWKVPGFWDGEGNWIVRFVPNKAGEWSYKTRSNDSELHNQFAGFTCVDSDDTTNTPPLLRVRTNPQPHFQIQNKTPFYPVSLPYPALENAPKSSKPEDAFPLFQKQIDTLTEQGANHLIGGYLLDTALGTNEGGNLFLNSDPSTINPRFFQWLDRRLTYLQFKGVLTDIGIAKRWDTATKTLTESQLRWLWRYVVARYSAYGVVWNLTESLNDTNQAELAAYALLTRQTDPLKHLLTASIAERAEGVPNLPLLKTDWLDYGVLRSKILPLPVGGERVVVVRDTDSNTETDLVRKRMWETQLRGGFWEIVPESSAQIPSEVQKAFLLCAKFFQKTRFSRLEPRQDLVGKPNETDAERRNRKKSIQSVEAQTQLPDQLKALLKEQARGSAVLALANAGREYVVYFPMGGAISLELLEATGTLKVAWYNPRTGDWKEEASVKGGDYLNFQAPDTKDWVLYIVRP